MLSKDEVSWIKESLMPIFRSLGFRRVDFVHGPLEAGRDLILADYDRFGLVKYYAVQVKAGDLRGRSDTQEIRIIVDQLRTAFETPYRDPLTGTEHKIAGVYLAVNGSITESARNIMYARTGGWFSIVDLAQLELAPLLLRTISDDDRRFRLIAVKSEVASNQMVLEPFLSLHRDASVESMNLILPIRPLRIRAIERYLEIGYSELNPKDIDILDTVLLECEAFNFLIERLPIGSIPTNDSESIRRAVDTIRTVGGLYIRSTDELKRGIENILGLERPAPGMRFEDQLFKNIDSD